MACLRNQRHSPTTDTKLRNDSMDITAHVKKRTSPRLNKTSDANQNDQAQVHSGHSRGASRQMSAAVKQKMQELNASGWRPEEEEMMSILDDEDYDAVDLVSDSDDGLDDGIIQRQEEQFFTTQDLLDDGQLSPYTRHPSPTSMNDLEMSFMNDDPIEADEPSAYTQMLTFDDNGQFAFGSEHDTANQELGRMIDAAAQRRVRFEELSEDSNADSSDDEEQLAHVFPDLFADDRGLNTPVESAHSRHHNDDASDAGSCWDFDGEDAYINIEHFGDHDSSSSSSSHDSDDSSDEGETTDEDDTPASSTLLVKDSPAVINTPVPAVATPASRSKTKQPLRPSTHSQSGRLPVAGTFILDPKRPVLLVDGSGSKQRNMIFPARIQSATDRQYWRRIHELCESRRSSPRTSVQLTPNLDIDVDESMTSAVEPSTNIMPFFDSLGALQTDQVVGPPEAFMPFTSIDAIGSVTADNDSMMQSDSEDDDVTFLDLVNLDGESTSEREEEGDEMHSESDAVPTPTTTASTPAWSTSPQPQKQNDLLSHLDRNRGLVGSFRRNQHFAKHLGSLASHPSLRASTLEMNAMQSGRRAAANTPITPLRKRRAAKAGMARRSPIHSPLTKVITKRKAHARGVHNVRY